MFVAAVAVSVLLAALLVFAAVRKLGRSEPVVRSYRAVGVPPGRLKLLALILLAGAAGLPAGALWAPLGVAAAAGLVCYFVLAVGAHIRADDARHLPTPVLMLALSVAALILWLATL